MKEAFEQSLAQLNESTVRNHMHIELMGIKLNHNRKSVANSRQRFTI